LHRHTACNFAHGAQKWQCAVSILNGLVRNRGNLLVGKLLGELRLRCKVQVSIENEVFTEEAKLGRKRLFNFDHHVGAPSLFRRANNGCAHAEVVGIFDTSALTSSLLNQHLVSATGEALHARRGHANTVLTRFDFFRYANNH
jgi:hypothetical protein